MSEVSDVVAAYDKGLLGHRDGVLQLGTHGENLARRLDGEGQCLWHVASGPPDHLYATPRCSDDRIVTADMNQPVVCQHTVDHGAEAGKGVAVGVSDRVVGLVAAAQHERPRYLGHENVVQRGVRKHQSQVGHSRCNFVGDRGIRSTAGEHDGPRDTAESGHGLWIEHTQRSCNLQVPDHEGEGLVIPRLAAPELGHRLVIGRVAGQVVATDAFHGEDPARAECFGHRGESGNALGHGPSSRVVERDVRTTGGTSVRLCVEAPICRVVVLCLALGAHLESGHGRGGSVVGD